MAWEILTTDMVLDQFTTIEKSALDHAQGQDGSTLEDVLQKAIDQARGDIADGGHPVDVDATKLPKGLHNDIIALARYNFLAGVPGGEDLITEPRKKAASEALKKLRDIAVGNRRVEAPEGSPRNVPAAQWNAENRVVGRMNPTPRPGNQIGGSAGRYANEEGPEDAS